MVTIIIIIIIDGQSALIVKDKFIRDGYKIYQLQICA